MNGEKFMATQSYKEVNAEDYIVDKEPFFMPTSDEVEVFQAAYNERVPILLKGPTGTGKSTLLASAFREIDDGSKNIVTAEDPIEYDMGGDIQQFPVIRAKGQTFSNLLRTLSSLLQHTGHWGICTTILPL